MPKKNHLPPLVVGADIGHGFTKIAYSTGPGEHVVTHSLPSVVSLAEEDISLINPEELAAFMVEYGGDRYFIGSLATCVDDSRQLKNRDDANVAEGPVWQALMRGALGVAMRGYYHRHQAWPEDIFVASGLPVRFYDSEKARERLIDSIEAIEPFHVGNVLHPVQPGRIRAFCLPQSYASFLNELFDDAGNVREGTPLADAEVIGIMDIGHRTTDLAFIQMRNGRYNYIPSRKGFKEIGMRDVFRRLLDGIFKTHHITVPESRTSRMLVFRDGKCTLRAGGNREIDVSDLAEDALQSVASRVCDSVSFGWNLEEIDVLLLTGGAGLRLHDAIRKAGGDRFERLLLCADGFFANAKGYAKYADIEAEAFAENAPANQEQPQKQAA